MPGMVDARASREMTSIANATFELLQREHDSSSIASMTPFPLARIRCARNTQFQAKAGICPCRMCECRSAELIVPGVRGHLPPISSVIIIAGDLDQEAIVRIVSRVHRSMFHMHEVLSLILLFHRMRIA